jgi:PAS domain-containing protein
VLKSERFVKITTFIFETSAKLDNLIRIRRIICEMRNFLKSKFALISELKEIQNKYSALKEKYDRGLSEKEKEKILLEKLINSSEQLIQYSDNNPDFVEILKIASDISGAKYGAFNVFDENGLDFTTVAIFGVKENLLRASSLLGFDLVNKHWDHDPNRAEKTKHHTISNYKALHDLTGEVLPKGIIFLLEKTFSLGETIIVKITKENKVLGDFTLFMDSGSVFMNSNYLELYAHQVGMFLDRVKIIRAGQESEKRHSSMIANISDIISIVNPDGSIKYISPNVENVFGWKSSEL